MQLDNFPQRLLFFHVYLLHALIFGLGTLHKNTKPAWNETKIIELSPFIQELSYKRCSEGDRRADFEHGRNSTFLGVKTSIICLSTHHLILWT